MARAAWVVLAAVVGGWSFGVAAASQVGGGILNAALPPIGAAAGYWLARLGAGPDGPRPGRGQVKYWRGRAFHDDDR
jgi:hypothetical protein